MKKITILILIFLCVLFIGCNRTDEKPNDENDKTPVEETKIIISFVTNCDIQKDDEVLGDNTLDPLTREGYVFEGWYLDSELKVKANKDTIQSSLKVYAKWSEVKISVKIFNNDALIDMLNIKYGEDIDMNKYLLDGLKFLSSDKEYKNIKENIELHCVFEELTNTILFITSEDKIEVKLFNPELVGLQLEFKCDKACEFSDVLPKASTKVSGDAYKFIYSNNKNITSTKVLFNLSDSVKVSDITVKAYKLLASGDIVDLEVACIVYK